MKPGLGLILSFLVLSVPSWAAPVLVEVEVTVAPSGADGEQWAVTAIYQLEGGQVDEVVRFRAIRFPGQDAGWEVDLSNAELVAPLDFDQPRSVAFGVRLDGSDQEISLNYRIVREGNPRLPVFVPDLPVDATIHVSVFLGPLEWSGASMPSLTEGPDGKWTSQSSHLPGLLYLPVHGPGRDTRSFPIAPLTDLLLLILVAMGSFYWWYLRRRARAELKEKEGTAS